MLLKKLKQIGLQGLLFTCEAGFELLRAWFLIHSTPFSYYSRYLGEVAPIQATHIPTYSNPLLVFALRSAVLRFAKFSPIPTRCLAQAMAVRQLMKRRGLDTEIFLGVNKQEGKLAAHAWSKHGDLFLTGNKGYTKFTVIARFVTLF